MKKLALLILPLVLVAQVWTVAAQPEEKRPKIEFVLLPEGETIQGVFSKNVTAQVYVFSASAGDVVSLNMTATGNSGLDPFVILLGPRGEVLAVDDDSAGDLNAQIRDIEISSDGAHFVVATSFIYVTTLLAEESGLSGDQDYEITASGFTRPAEEEVALQFFSGRIEIGQEADGIINEAEPVYFYTFPAQAGQVVDVRVNSGDFDTLLYLMDPSGNRIGVNDDGEGEDNYTDSNLLGVELPADGLYMAFATQIFYHRPELFEGGEFKISVTESK